jgi:hypothetical protein
VSGFGADAPRIADPIRLPLTFVHSNPVTTITVGGRSVQAIVDISGGDYAGAAITLWPPDTTNPAGANAYSMLPLSLVDKLGLATATHGSDSPRFHHARTLSAAGQDPGPLEFVVLPLEIPTDFEGMLGGNFFDHHVVCLDYRRREIRVR